MISLNWIFRKRAYKATYNMTCKNITYEVGKTYAMEEEPIVCNQGFHFCKKAKDTLNYYQFDNQFILLEIKALGEVHTLNNKSATNKMKVIRIIPRKKILKFLKINAKYDKNDNLIYYKDKLGHEDKWRYDDQNRMIYHESIYKGIKESSDYRYDENGKRKYLFCPIKGINV